jgi:hypothetical protein
MVNPGRIERKHVRLLRRERARASPRRSIIALLDIAIQILVKKFPDLPFSPAALGIVPKAAAA